MKNICDWDKCNKIGLYKAPVERDNSKRFRWLCLEHVKEFNKSWNYFANMNNQEIENFVKSDLTWHKPTKSFSSSENFLESFGLMPWMIKQDFSRMLEQIIIKSLPFRRKIKMP